MSSEARYTVVRREGGNYRTTPTLKPMTLQEATDEAAKLQAQYRDQKFVILGEVGEPSIDATVTIRPISGVPADDIVMKLPRKLSVAR
jgi:hypothetical protein